MDKLDSKFKAFLPHVIETPGERDIVEGQPCALFSQRVADFQNEYVIETSNSKKLVILSKALQTLGDEGFRVQKRAEGGGFQEADLKQAMDRVRKKITSTTKLKKQTVTDGALLPLERGRSIAVHNECHILPGCSKKHPANVAYRRKLSEVLHEFIAARTKEEEVEVCARVIGDLEREDLRFVNEDESQTELGRAKAIRKVKRSLRDMARLKKEA